MREASPTTKGARRCTNPDCEYGGRWIVGGDLGAKLKGLRTDTSPFDPPPRVPDAAWVRPRLVAQIAYAEWTADGKLRQPEFLGLRADKKPEE